jgi:aryl-alcohol dehydrogenase-like predicted oxidoreductase
MELRQFGPLDNVSALSLGGGGLGQLWGETTRAECISTVHLALEQGINFLDLAPSYGNGESETVVGLALDGKLPEGVRVSTKWWPEWPFPASQDIGRLVEESLVASLKLLKLEQVDLFFLHGLIIPDDQFGKIRGTPQTVFNNVVRPAFEQLIEKGLTKTWGISGIGVPQQIVDVMANDAAPAAVQIITNLMDSLGGLQTFEEDARPRELIKSANQSNVGVMGIRAIQAGALSDAMDRPLPKDHLDQIDYERAASFRVLAKQLGESTASLSHRYALSMTGVDTVVLGVKNRQELQECLDAEAKGPLDVELIAKLDQLYLNPSL